MEMLQLLQSHMARNPLGKFIHRTEAIVDATSISWCFSTWQLYTYAKICQLIKADPNIAVLTTDTIIIIKYILAHLQVLKSDVLLCVICYFQTCSLYKLHTLCL